MNINPYYIAQRGIDLINEYKLQIDKVINDYETGRTLNCFHGIRPSIPSSQYPCFEIETSTIDTEWGTTRGQRHNIGFKCMITVSCSKIDFREEYLLKITSAVVSILQDPKHMQFKIQCLTPTTGRGYMLSIYDSMVNSVNYSTREGTIGVGEFTWVAKVHETIPDINFSSVPAQIPGIVTPIVKEIR